MHFAMTAGKAMAFSQRWIAAQESPDPAPMREILWRDCELRVVDDAGDCTTVKGVRDVLLYWRSQVRPRRAARLPIDRVLFDTATPRVAVLYGPWEAPPTGDLVELNRAGQIVQAEIFEGARLPALASFTFAAPIISLAR